MNTVIEWDFCFTSAELAEFQFHFGLLLDSDNLTCLAVFKVVLPSGTKTSNGANQKCTQSPCLCQGRQNLLQCCAAACALCRSFGGKLKIKSRCWLSLFH